MIVMKFGGTSFIDPPSWNRVLAIVRSRIGSSPVVVASAIRGITDQLCECAESSAAGRRKETREAFERIASTHFEVCDWLGLDKAARLQIDEQVRKLDLCLENVLTNEQLSARTRDEILAYGELLSTILLVEFLKNSGLDAVQLDSRELLITNDRFSCAVPRANVSRKRVRSRILPMVRQGRLPVLPGFVGATEQGETTTIGRGGSDYSASLFSGWLQADELEIWKDVPGFMTADPRVVPEAVTIPFLTYDEAEQLCRYGAKILHFLAVRFAARQNIPLRVLFAGNPEEPGTLITWNPGLRSPQVVAMTSQKQTGRVIVVGEGLRDPEIAAQILGSCRGLEILRVSQNARRSRMIVITAAGEDTDRAIRQIHAGLRRSLSSVRSLNFHL